MSEARSAMRTALVGILLLCGIARSGAAAPDPAALFTTRCSGCHTYGKGVLVGPDLKGTTDRHSRTWLTAWIASPQRLIGSGDPAAVALREKYPFAMPDLGLSSSEVSLLLDFLAAGGPEAGARTGNRRADAATKEEIEIGRMLFVGERPLTGGSAACSACHRANDSLAGGSLGPDLRDAYARFQDRALASFLARGCFPRVPGAPLTDQESFALKAFLRDAGMSRQPAGAARLR